MKVSVIVPVYNVAQYLPKCLDSLVNQTLDSIEILVVNDGSTDHSQNIIDQYTYRFPNKIKAYCKHNGGLSDARNFALDYVTGEYISFVDSDDWVLPEMYSDMYALAVKHQAEMLICNLQKVDETGKITQRLEQIPNLPEKILLTENFSIFSEIGYFACNKLFKRELFSQKRFKKGFHFEDIQLIPQLLLECTCVAHSEKYHYQYFERSNSISKTHTFKGLDILKAVDDVTKCFKNSDYKNKQKILTDFQILQGVYSFLAYLAFVKDIDVYQKMKYEHHLFLKKNAISKWGIIRYKRFNKNYLVSLPLKKILFYCLWILNLDFLVKKMLKLISK